MLRSNSRLLFLVLLILLVVVAPVAANPGPNLAVTIAHTGNAGSNNVDFATGSSAGTVAVSVQNTGDAATDGTQITVTVTLDGGLAINGTATSSPNNHFTCSGTTTVTCITSDAIPDSTTDAANSSETITFNVTAPGAAASGPFTNTAAVTGGGAPNANASDPQTFAVVTPVVDLAVTSVTHNGDSGSNFIAGNSDGKVSVAIQNIGTISSSGTVTVTITLGGGLAFNAIVSTSLFGSSGDCVATSSGVTCSKAVAIGPGTGDTIVFTVNAPGTTGVNFQNSASVFVNGDSNNANNNAVDATPFNIVLAGTNTPTTTPSLTPFPTFPIPTFTAVPTLAVPTATPTATLIPNPATSTPLPRLANAGQAVGPVPHANVTVVVNRDGINVRLIPAIGAEVIANLNAGYTTDILARSPDNQWVQVMIDGQLGWIGTAVLTILSGDLNSAPVADPRTIPYGGFENPRAGLTSVTSAYTGKLQLSGLRVRGGPGRAYPVLANAPRYTIFSLLGRTADGLWVQVNFEGTLGWVATEFVEFQQGGNVLGALPVDGIVADALPISTSTGDALTDTLKLMLSRVELAQPSLDAIRSLWTSIALGQPAQCGSFPARPTGFNIPNQVLAPFYATLFPLNTDFNSAMTSLRQAIDLLIDVCQGRQSASQPVVQQALDAINQTDALFVSLRQRLTALLPEEQPLNDNSCLFTFQGRSQVVPRLSLNQVQLAHLTAHDFVLGFCFDAGAGQSLKLQALIFTGNAQPRITISAFDNPTNFIGSTAFGAGTTDVSIQPILITQTDRYIVILADLDGAPKGTLDGQIALLLTDVTANSGLGAPTMAIDPTTGNLILLQGGAIAPVTPGVNGSTSGGGSTALTPGFGTPTRTPIPTINAG